MTRGKIVLWDVRVARTAAAVTLGAFLLALLLTAATDEGGIGWNVRVARALNALPACGGFAAWVAIAGRRGRGEVRALATLGQSAARSAMPAVVGAAAAAVLLTFVVTLAPRFDVETFFPKVTRAATVVWKDDAFVDEAAGLRILADGSLQRLASAPAAAADGTNTRTRSPTTARVAIAIVSVFASAAFALLFGRAGAQGGSSIKKRDLGSALFASGLTIVLFHFVAQGRAALLVSTLPAIALFAFAVVRYREESWQE